MGIVAAIDEGSGKGPCVGGHDLLYVTRGPSRDSIPFQIRDISSGSDPAEEVNISSPCTPHGHLWWKPPLGTNPWPNGLPER